MVKLTRRGALRTVFVSTASFQGGLVVAMPEDAAQPDPIRFEVGPGKTARVTIPNIRKEDLISILATFFANDKPELKDKIQALFRQSSDVTVVLTTGK